MRYFHAVMSSIVSIVSGLLSQVSASEIDQVLANYPIITRGEIDCTATCLHSYHRDYPEIWNYKLHIDGLKFKSRETLSGKTRRDGKWVELSSTGEMIITDRGLIGYSLDPNGRYLGDGIFAYLKPYDDPKNDRTFHHYSYMLHGKFGYSANLSLNKIFRDSNVKCDLDRIGGQDTIKFSTHSKWGKFECWVDPRRSHIVIQLIYELNENDWIDENKPLKADIRDSDADTQVYPVHYKEHYTANEVSQFGGRNVVTGYVCKSEEMYSNHTSSDTVTNCRITRLKNVTSWDRDPFVPSVAIPDGERVTVFDDRPIEYEWRGGQIVKKINTAAVAAAERAEFVAAPRGWLSGPWVVAGGVGVVIGVVAVLARRARRQA